MTNPVPVTPPVVYNFDANGYFLGTSTPQRSPLERGPNGEPVYWTPAKATTTPPPSDASGNVLPPPSGQEHQWNKTTKQWALATSRAIMKQNQQLEEANAIQIEMNAKIAQQSGGSF